MMAAALLVTVLFAAQPIMIDEAKLAELPVSEVLLNDHGTPVVCSGPTLASVLENAGLPTGRNLRGDALQIAVLARGRDGYGVLFSLGELDPTLGAAPIIVAFECDGVPLSPEVGPYRIVAEGEQRGARSVRQLESLTILRPQSPPL